MCERQTNEHQAASQKEAVNHVAALGKYVHKILTIFHNTASEQLEAKHV